MIMHERVIRKKLDQKINCTCQNQPNVSVHQDNLSENRMRSIVNIFSLWANNCTTETI